MVDFYIKDLETDESVIDSFELDDFNNILETLRVLGNTCICVADHTTGILENRIIKREDIITIH